VRPNGVARRPHTGTAVNGGDQGGAFGWPVRVYYEDTDAGGIVYYANYLRFMERARTEFLRELGVEQDVLRDEHNLQFVVRRVCVDYHAPARFNEVLLVSVAVERLRGASVDLSQTVVRDGTTRPLVSGSVQIACVHSESGAPRPIPKTLREALNGAS